jgi:hypothetical protein
VSTRISSGMSPSKFCPEALARDSERVARLQREAQLLPSLVDRQNKSTVCGIYIRRRKCREDFGSTLLGSTDTSENASDYSSLIRSLISCADGSGIKLLDLSKSREVGIS